jgi:hypothetical protein
MEQHDKKNSIENVYLEILSVKKDLPVYADFLGNNITKDTIRYHFGSITDLHKHMKNNYSKEIDKVLYSVEKAFSENKNAKNANSKTYIITTAVAGAKADKNFLLSLKNYCNVNDAQIIIMPCESITNSFENKTATFDPEFIDGNYLFVQEDTKLNENLYLCSIQVSAKQPRPITGLSRLGKRDGSYIFASPKQFLEYVPSGHTHNKNYTIMTPGACTKPDYYSENFVSKRLSYIADKDHTIGAIIVEIKNDQLFDFRQIQSDSEGSFIDLGKEYTKDGNVNNVPVNIVFGDFHSASIDTEALHYFFDKFSKFNIDNVFLHDIFDGYSISHHVTNIGERTMRNINNRHSLIDELYETYEVIKSVETELKPKKINVVKSNHDEVLSRYLKEGRYVNDPENHYMALKIAPSIFEDRDPLKDGILLSLSYKKITDNLSNFVFLSRKDSVIISNVECGAHGDLGINGAKPSLTTFEKVYGNCIVGHSHTPAIQRGVFQVGTLSKLDLGYNRGPSSWMNTCCLLYNNGQRQLINYVR